MSCTSVIAVVFTSCILFGTAASSNNVVQMSQNGVMNDDVGNLTNCGSPDSKFIFDWSPRVLRPGITVTFDLIFETIATFEHGNLCVTVWLQGVPDPIYQDCHDQSCEDIQKAVKKFYPISCPLAKGWGLSLKKFSYKLEPTIPLPSGKFTAKASIENQDKVVLLCVNGNVEIIDE